MRLPLPEILVPVKIIRSMKKPSVLCTVCGRNIGGNTESNLVQPRKKEQKTPP